MLHRFSLLTLVMPLIFSLSFASAHAEGYGEGATYQVPKQNASPAAAPAGHTSGAPLVWAGPKTWQQDSVPGTMQLVSFSVPSAGPDKTMAKASIVILGGQAGGIADNVNRWRGQVGMPAISEAEIKSQLKETKGSEGPITWYDVRGPEKSIAVAIIDKKTHTLFVKLIGENATVAANKDAFKAFATSVHYAQGQ